MKAGKSIGSLLLAVALLVSLFAALGTPALAAEELKNLRFDTADGCVKWDTVAGADTYSLEFFTSTNSRTAERYAAHTSLPTMNVREFLDLAPHRTGYYSVTVEAIASGTKAVLASVRWPAATTNPFFTSLPLPAPHGTGLLSHGTTCRRPPAIRSSSASAPMHSPSPISSTAFPRRAPAYPWRS